MVRAALALVMLIGSGTAQASTFAYDFTGSGAVGGGMVNGQVRFNYPSTVTPETTPRADLEALVASGPQIGQGLDINDVSTRLTRISAGEGFLGLSGRDSFLFYGVPRSGPGETVNPNGFFGGFVWIGNAPVNGENQPATRYTITELSFETPAPVPVPQSLSLILLAIGSLLALPALGKRRGQLKLSAI